MKSLALLALPILTGSVFIEAANGSCDLIEVLNEYVAKNEYSPALLEKIAHDFEQQGYEPNSIKRMLASAKQRRVKLFRYTDPNFPEYLEELGFTHEQAKMIIAAQLKRAAAKKVLATFHKLETLEKIAGKFGVTLDKTKYRPFISINEGLIEAGKVADKLVHEISHLRFKIISDHYLKGEDVYFGNLPKALELVDECVAFAVQYQVPSSKKKGLIGIILKTYGDPQSNEQFLRFVFYLQKAKSRSIEDISLSTIIKQAMTVTAKQIDASIRQHPTEWQSFYKINGP